MTEKDGKSCFTIKKMISTSQWHAEHLYIGRNTQYMKYSRTFFWINQGEINSFCKEQKIFKCTQILLDEKKLNRFRVNSLFNLVPAILEYVCIWQRSILLLKSKNQLPLANFSISESLFYFVSLFFFVFKKPLPEY